MMNNIPGTNFSRHKICMTKWMVYGKIYERMKITNGRKRNGLLPQTYGLKESLLLIRLNTSQSPKLPFRLEVQVDQEIHLFPEK